MTQHTITAHTSGQRLDQLLTEALADLSRARVQKLIADGLVCRSDGQPVTKTGHKTSTGDVYVVTVPAPTPLGVLPQNLPLDVLYEDEHLIVINKSADMAVHPATGTPDGTLVNALLHHCGGKLSGIGGVERPGIVHRLDKGTSGVMVVAKDDIAHQGLSEQFANRTMERFYLAILTGQLSPSKSEVEGNIGRHPGDRKKMTVLKSGGKPAKTAYEVLARFAPFCLARLKLHTGRTHQIRVHMQHLGHPVLGDPVYARPKKWPELTLEQAKAVAALDHQALHAAVLGFTHPHTKKVLQFSTKPPEDMLKILDLFKVTI
ncbi:MAG: RluA family pseudouridine synthase [Proteobacteria bacterium]|nr:RluA family pseudouridine synthase [Pseudomonadota bacterium]